MLYPARCWGWLAANLDLEIQRVFLRNPGTGIEAEWSREVEVAPAPE